MDAFTVHEGGVMPLDRNNVDTDAIIPKQYLKSVEKTGFGPFLFDDWRYLDAGDLSVDPASRRVNPDFVLNDERYSGSSILMARKNFGCGSSREHAVWALLDYGFRAVLAPSYADIFYNNCFKNGVLPIVLDEAIIDELFAKVMAEPGYQLTINLQAQQIHRADGPSIPFDVDPFRRSCLLQGLDDIGLTLKKSDKIKAYEAKRLTTAPWLFA